MRSIFTFFLLLALMVSGKVWGQATYYSQGSLAPNLTSSWNSQRTGGGSSPIDFSTGSVTYVIQNGHTMTTTATWSISGTSTKLQIEDGGTLQADHAVTLSSTTTFQIDGGGTYIHNNGVTNNATTPVVFNGIEDFKPLSNFEIRNWNVNGTNIGAFPSGIAWGNIIVKWNPPASWNFTGAITSIQGSFTIDNSATSNHIRFVGNASLTLNISNDLNIVSGSLQFSNAGANTNTFILNLGGSYNQTGGSFSANVNSSSNLSINLTGVNKSFTQSGGTLTNTQINWKINDGASLTLNNNLPVASGRTLTVGEGSSGVLDLGTNLVSGAGTITTAAGSTLKTAHVNGINGNLTISNRSLNAATNYVFNGTSDQVTGSYITSARDITLENTSGKVALSNNISVSGTVSIPSGTKLDAASYVISGTGNVVVGSGGTFVSSHASGLNGNNTTTGGSSSYNTAGYYEFNTSGAQVSGIFLPSTVNNLSTSGTSQLTLSNSGTLNISNNLSIGSGTSFSVGNDQYVTVSGTLTNSGTLTIKSNASGTGSLIHSSSGVSATVERYVAGHGNVAAEGWHLMGSPVATFNITGSSYQPGTNDDLYAWSESTNTWLNYKAGNPTQIVPGTGYLVAYENTGTKSFSGTLNVSNVSVSGLAHNASQGKGWHLLGNPFASAIKWNNGSWALNNIAGIAKIWNSTSKAYTDIEKDYNDIIPAAQGFFVQVAESTTGSLTIPATARTHSTTAWYKNNTPRIMLSASPADGSSRQESQIRLESEATAGFDFYWDSRFLEGYAPKFYSIAGNEKLSTNAMPSVQNGTSIPFGFEKNQHSSFVIRLEESLPGETIFLKDLKLNTVHNLSQNPEYLFSASQGDDPNRFLLVFGTVGVDEKPAAQAQLQAYMANGKLWVNNPAENSQLAVFDLSGRLLVLQQLRSKGLQQLSLNLQKGAYILRLTEGNSSLSTKVINQ